MEHFPEMPPNLTKNQALVLAALSNSSGPLSAYTILDLLRNKGFRAPLQVYRALDKLVEYGMVHRLESMNAFVACQHSDGGNLSTVAFTICGTCGDVAEISNEALETTLSKLAMNLGFTPKKSMIEIFGYCDLCH